jgi:polar amino acid transport system substrate-binding protein
VNEAPRAYELLASPPAQRPRGAILLRYPEGESHTPRATERSVAAVAHPVSAPPKVGFIGCGSFARSVLVPAFQAAGAHLELVGGGGGPSAEAAVRQLGFARAAESEEAVIEDEAVDAVVISTRHGTHARLATLALSAGKHVFCEKPLALDAPELQEVLSAARESGGILAVGFNRRFSPLLVDLREFVSGAAAGPITATYRVSAGEIPADHWVHDLEQGGGRVIGEVCHFIDSLEFVAGSPIVEIHAAAQNRNGQALQSRDNVVVSVTHADGSVGSIAYVARSAPGIGKERVEAFGDGGIAVLDDYRSLELYGPGGKRRRSERRPEKGHREEVVAFLSAIRTGEQPVSLDIVENVSLATLAAVESMRTGMAVRVESRS